MVAFLSFVTLVLAGMVVASPVELKMESNLGKRDTVNCPYSTQASLISDAISEAVSLTNAAIDYINAHGVTDDVFVSYFGTVQDATTQLGVFKNVVSANTPIFNCLDTTATCANNNNIGNFGAYNDGLNIYFCPSFFHQPDTTSLCSNIFDTDHLRGGTVLQQLTSSLDQTTPVYTCLQAWGRARSDPGSAARTGDNYRCFAEQVYINANCPSHGV